MPRKTKEQVAAQQEAENKGAALIITENKGEKLSKAQIQFNNLTQQIVQAKLEIENIEADLAKVSVKVAKDFLPLLEKSRMKLREYVIVLDEAAQKYELNKGERKTLERHIHETAWEVYTGILSKGEKDEEMKAIHDKYSPESADEIMKEEKELQQDLFKNLFGADIDIEKIDDPEYLNDIKEQFKNRETEDEAPQRKKTKKQLEKEAEEEAKKQLEAKDARSIYTSLAKMLHPDLEQDENERLRKTEMMKSVTEAYANNDFFGLLKLQLEYNMAHPENLAGLAEAQLNRYISMLKKQKQELEHQKYAMRQGNASFLFEKFFTWTNKFSQQKYSQELKKIRYDLEQFENEIAIALNPKLLRERLKELKQEQKHQDQFGNFFSF